MQVASEETKRVLGELEELPFKGKENFDVKNLRTLFNLFLKYRLSIIIMKKVRLAN